MICEGVFTDRPRSLGGAVSCRYDVAACTAAAGTLENMVVDSKLVFISAVTLELL